MSFVTEKSLICSFCLKKTITSEENFPDDLHDELRQRNIPQIRWICKSCDRENEPCPKKTRMEDEIEELKVKFNSLNSDLTQVKQTDIAGLRNVLEDINSDVTYIKNYIADLVSEKRKYLSDVGSESRSNADDADSTSVGRTMTPAKNDLSSDSSTKNKTALPILHDILKREIKIDENQAAKSAKIVNSFIVDTLIPAWEKDDVFACLYKRIYYTGSSFNELRISEATEYDINIILTVPKQISLEPEFFKDTPTFAKVKWSERDAIPANKAQVVKFLQKVSHLGFLDPLKVTSWFQSLIDKFILSYPQIQDVKQIKSFQSGPARTVELFTVHGYSICIDLVPVFDFNYSALKEEPIFNTLNKYPVEKSKEFWFLVPKVCKGEQSMLAHEAKLSWRMHVPEAERAILHNKQCAKPVIKLLKLLRNKLGWNNCVSSYHCTNVILWELNKNPDPEYWSGKFLYERVLEALKCLAEYLGRKKLPYIFNSEYNLFYQVNESNGNNNCNRLNRIITAIEADPSSLIKYF